MTSSSIVSTSITTTRPRVILTCGLFFVVSRRTKSVPTLLDLIAIKGVDGKPLRVIETIAADKYKKFGMFLLQDMNGVTVDLIEKDHISKGAENVTQAILQKWLTSDAPTRTYQHLIECLRQSELGALAELIANTTGMYHAVYIHAPGITCITLFTHKM